MAVVALIYYLKILIIVACAVAVVYVVAAAAGWPIPKAVGQVLVILGVAVLGILALTFLAGLL